MSHFDVCWPHLACWGVNKHLLWYHPAQLSNLILCSLWAIFFPINNGPISIKLYIPWVVSPDSMSLKQPASDSPSTHSQRAHKVLTLCKKVKVIEAVNGGMSHRNAAIKFGVGWTQISNIIHDQQNINKLYTEGNNANTKYLAPRALQYPEIDEECWKYFWSKNQELTS